jgi:hypothetical protein
MDTNDCIISLNNKRVYEFYKKNPNVSFEVANELLVGFMETIFNHMTENLNENINSQLLNFMKENQSQICELSQGIQTINANISSSNEILFKNMDSQLTTLKTNYISEVKELLANNSLQANEKINTLLDKNTISLIDKTTLILNDIIPKNQDKVYQLIQENLNKFHTAINGDIRNMVDSISDEQSRHDFLNMIDSKYSSLTQSIQNPIFTYINASEERLSKNIDYLKENSSLSSGVQSKLFNGLEEFLNKYQNSSNKGKFGEHRLNNVINSLYSNAEITNTSGTKAAGDFIMKRPTKPTILFENKEYDHNIPKDEVSKFIRDIDIQNIHGIFMSQNSGITFKNNFQIDIHKGNVLVYIQNCEYSPDKIKLAVDIIDNFAIKLCEIDGRTLENTISKSVLDDINEEYQKFISQRDNMLINMRDFNKKMSSAISLLKLPSLDTYLSTKYAVLIRHIHLQMFINVIFVIFLSVIINKVYLLINVHVLKNKKKIIKNLQSLYTLLNFFTPK